MIVCFKRPTCITVNQVCNHGDSPEKGSQNKSKKSQFSSILLQLWIIALAILAEITDRVLICWIVTNVSAVRILQDKIANLVSASRSADPFVYINGPHWIIIRKVRKKCQMFMVRGSSL